MRGPGSISLWQVSIGKSNVLVKTRSFSTNDFFAMEQAFSSTILTDLEIRLPIVKSKGSPRGRVHK